jgi:hypothetical protein
MYDSVRKNQGNHEVWILSADDACSDGTGEYYSELATKDPYFKFITNPGPNRLGHTILYDRIIWELCETELAMIFHCDMHLCPDALDAIEKWMYTKVVGTETNVQRLKQVISLTRIEPPLHPSGVEKLIEDCGIEPETFNEEKLLRFVNLSLLSRAERNVPKISNGVFAPWAFWVDEYKEIGGNDWKNFAPQSKEDSDIWNRLLLNGTRFIQTWEGFVYHMTCRGSRFNPLLTTPGTNSTEWETQNIKSYRNFIRKWGQLVSHDEYLHPIVHHKYNIGFIINNCTYNQLYNLEIWCDDIQVDLEEEIIQRYIEFEQPNTPVELAYKINSQIIKPIPEIIVMTNGSRLTEDDYVNIQHLSQILTNSCDGPGEYEVGNLRINVKNLNHYEKNLIECKNEF